MVFHMLGEMPSAIKILIAFLLIFSVCFTAFFFVPALFLLVRLKRIAHGLGSSSQGALDPASIDMIVRSERYIARSWDNYKKTLVVPRQNPGAHGGGQKWAATVPANACFDRHENVELPLRLDFFRYCPGLMTGMGILGTFSGLLLGLRQFSYAIAGNEEVSNRASVVEPDAGATDTFVAFGNAAFPPAAVDTPLKILDGPASVAHGAGAAQALHSAGPLSKVTMMDALSNLLFSVSEAFAVSAMAMLCAMVMKFLEKFLITHCFRALQDVIALLDDMYSFSHADDYMLRSIISDRLRASDLFCERQTV